MRPADVDKIADAVVGTLAGADPGLLGCGSLSNPVEFDVDFLQCGTFECGGIALFGCRARFGCGVNGTATTSATTFYCDDEFFCDQYGLPACPAFESVYSCNGANLNGFALP